VKNFNISFINNLNDILRIKSWGFGNLKGTSTHSFNPFGIIVSNLFFSFLSAFDY